MTTLPNSFRVQCGKIVISDPCYEAGNKWAGMLDAKNGAWIASVEPYERENRIAMLFAQHRYAQVVSKSTVALGVDSGQMSIVDANEYRRDCVAKLTKPGLTGESDWYDMCCEKTLSKEGYGTIPNGVVSCTGFGDGVYQAEIGKDADGKVVSVEVRFIDEDDGTEECDCCGNSYDESELWNGQCPECRVETCEVCGSLIDKSELIYGLCYDCREGEDDE